MRASWGIGLDPSCQLCGSSDETVIHVLRDFQHSNKIWEYFGKLPSHDPLLNWLDENLSSKTLHSGVEWRIIYAVSLWRIWTRRCDYIMKDEEVSLEVSPIVLNIMYAYCRGNYASFI